MFDTTDTTCYFEVVGHSTSSSIMQKEHSYQILIFKFEHAITYLERRRTVSNNA